MKIAWIRHGKTNGNEKQRYIGRTDESLSEKGKAMLYTRKEYNIYPEAELVFVSPMRRCVETADILYPNIRQIVIEQWKECDFGEFENKNYQELSGNKNYQKWILSNGMLPFPGGESREEFQKRCMYGWASAEKLLKGYTELSRIACIVHGGTIMAVLEKCAVLHRSYYSWQVQNNCGYVCDYKNHSLEILEEIM